MRMLSLPEVIPAEVQIWLLTLDLVAPPGSEDWALLNDDEKARVRRYYHHADRIRSAATRAALRRCLGKCLHEKASCLVFATNAYDKPFLPDHPQVAFNISHSGKHALIAIAAGSQLLSLGVDIECHKVDIEFEEVGNYAFTPLERSILPGYGNGGAVGDGVCVNAFFRQWSGKEAVLKAVGVGISEHLQNVSIRPADDGRLSVEGGMDDWAPITGHTLGAPAGYSAAIAWQSGGSP